MNIYLIMYTFTKTLNTLDIQQQYRIVPQYWVLGNVLIVLLNKKVELRIVLYK